MQKEDLHLFGLLEFHPDDGEMFCKDERMLVWTASALGALQRLLVTRHGIDEARRILCQAAYLHGFHNCLTAKQLFGENHDGRCIGPRFPEVMGFGRYKSTHIVEGSDPPSFYIETGCKHSVEVDQFLINFGRSDTPVCWWAAGFASGYCSAHFGFEVYYKELRCAAQGNSICQFLGQDVTQWDEGAVSALRADYGFENAAKAKEFREQRYELHRQWHLRHKLGRDDTSENSRLEKRSLRERLASFTDEGGFIVREKEMWEALEQALCVARLNTPVLVHGETGTGKEFLVNLIYRQSARAARPLVSINCAALTETLLESELFGHVRGAFTGAVAEKPGLLELASDGTLFLDEVGEMPLSTQAKLLRVLENGEMRRVGGTQLVRVHPRVLAATNRDLEVLVAKGLFRQDLYFRLNPFVIELPPLRQRRDSIPAMVHRFLQQASKGFNKPIEAVSPEAMSMLTAYRWPGNVRELRHAIERAAVVANGGVIEASDLPAEITRPKQANAAMSLVQGRKDRERQAIIDMLAQHGGKRTETAAALEINVTTLWRKMRRFGLL